MLEQWCQENRNLIYAHIIHHTEKVRNLSNLAVFVEQRKVLVASWFTDMTLVLQPACSVCENERTAPAVAVWWQWRTSVFARSAAVVWDWWGKTTSQCPWRSRCPCESTHSQSCLCAWREFGPQSRQQQSFIDNSTKSFGDRWTLAGPELMFLFFGVSALVQSRLLCHITP